MMSFSVCRYEFDTALNRMMPQLPAVATIYVPDDDLGWMTYASTLFGSFLPTTAREIYLGPTQVAVAESHLIPAQVWLREDLRRLTSER